MLQSRMSRIFTVVVALACMAGGAWAQPVRGLIVKLKEAPAAAGREAPQAVRERIAAVAQGAGVPMHSQREVGGHGHRLMRFATPRAGRELDAALRRLRLHPEVEYAEPDVLVKPLEIPNDPDFLTRQWHLHQPTPVFRSAINMPPAWDRTPGGNITVAVLDTGIRPSHPDLAGRLLPGYDFASEVEYANDGDGRDADPSDPGDWVSASDIATKPGIFGGCGTSDSSWHGTFIAAQIAALTNNGTGVAGINRNAAILPVRVSGKCGAFLSDILDGMRWAAGLPVAGVPANPTPARVINLSFGGDAACSASYQDVINEVANAGALVVVAAGNESGPLRRPADCSGVLSVGAVGQGGLKADYSNFGSNLAVMAPGGTGNSGDATNIWSATNLGTTSPGADSYGYKRGTSFSAPLAAGVASLMLTLNPALPPDQLIARIRAGARVHTFTAGFGTCGSAAGTCNCTTATCGAGLLDANGATAQALLPVALIADVGAPTSGATITLDGQSSTGAPGATLVGYAWSQVSGPAASMESPGASTTAVVLPAGAATFVFRLAVTDNAGRTGEDFISFTTQPPASSGGGGGAVPWAWGAGLWLLALWAMRRRRQAFAGH